jgi:hypothetical protein
MVAKARGDGCLRRGPIGRGNGTQRLIVRHEGVDQRCFGSSFTQSIGETDLRAKFTSFVGCSNNSLRNRRRQGRHVL